MYNLTTRYVPELRLIKVDFNNICRLQYTTLPLDRLMDICIFVLPHKTLWFNLLEGNKLNCILNINIIHV